MTREYSGIYRRMSSNIFENLHSPASYDPSIDNGWQEKSGTGDDPVQSILFLLEQVYWEAVTDEMANAILAFDDYKTFAPDGLPELTDDSFESEYLRELLDLWDPLGLSEEKKGKICENIFNIAKGRQQGSYDMWLATALLQACGFTDYDFVQEYRRPTFPSLGPAPLVDTKHPGIYEAIQCSECRFCIRSFHFYECKEGCADCAIYRNHLKSVPKDRSESLGHFFLGYMSRIPFRLCCNCMDKTSHPRSHLKVVWRFKKAGDQENHKFSSELDALEDHIKGQGLLSFGKAFLDYISLGGFRLSSANSRQLFPAGNAHCALMFGPLLIENGMTLRPGGALISTRSLPTLGRFSSREVKEYLHPERFRTIDGLDVFCTDLYAVSANRRIHVATKRARERRFLCARKQVSGGLFTSFNSNVFWMLREQKMIDLFLDLAQEWRKRKSLSGPEAKNRRLLLECATQLSEEMRFLFSQEIRLHLFLFAQKLGKAQKLAYSRMSNNCQDFCNGLLNYEKFLDPIFDTMYPFIPVSLSDDIIKGSDDHCLSYLQSFSRPLQYPIPGSQSRRAMLGSAIAMYSSFSQNDADLIDHVWSVRFGYDQENYFSLGMTFGSRKEGDPYLLKDEEMSCSDRFAASQLTGPHSSRICTLADHLLDCPSDNLSVLQTHLLRQKKYYYNAEGEFLTNLGPAAWLTNRLEILRRLKILHDFLAGIVIQFQNCCKELLPPKPDVKSLRSIWQPTGTVFSRAWHMDQRKGRKLYFAPDIDFGGGEMDNWKAVGFFTLGLPLFETHRQLLNSRELFIARLKTLKSLLSARLSGSESTWSPWDWCSCSDCKVYKLQYTCSRLDWNFISAVDSDTPGEVIKPGHPDYVSTQELEKLLQNREYWEEIPKDKEYLLESEEKRHESTGSDWKTTYYLSLMLIFGIDTAQQIRDRLDYYKLVFQGKET